VSPVVKVLENDANTPPSAGVLNEPQVGKSFLKALVRLLLGWPIGELRQSRPAWATCRVEVAHQHMIQQDIVQTSGGQARAAQVSVNIEDGQFGQSLFN